METVKLVTGHGTANTVLKFYYNPQREHLRSVLGEKLPDVLTGLKSAKPISRTGRAKRLTAPGEAHVTSLVAQLERLSATERMQLAAMLAEDDQ